MNVRKPVDYGMMYRELTAILAQNLSQMEEIHAIGKAIRQRPEKGAAVAAAEFLQANFPDRTGFSPRNVRRMRDFYRTYENDQTLLRLAMKIGWTLNVVIMESELTMDARRWYLRKANTGGLSKAALLRMIESAAHLEISLDESKQGWHHNFISSRRRPAGKKSAIRFILWRGASWRNMGSIAAVMQRGS